MHRTNERQLVYMCLLFQQCSVRFINVAFSLITNDGTINWNMNWVSKISRVILESESALEKFDLISEVINDSS